MRARGRVVVVNEEEYFWGNTRSAAWNERTNETDNGSFDRPSVFPIEDAADHRVSRNRNIGERIHRLILGMCVSLSPSSLFLSFSVDYLSVGDCFGKKDTRRKRTLFKERERERERENVTS